MSSKNQQICPRCKGSGSVTKVSNTEWPKGTDPHIYHVSCPDCGGWGKREVKGKQYYHFYCPRCERVATKPWPDCWCLGNGKFVPYGPSDIDTDWQRMRQVALIVRSEPRVGKEYDVLTTGSTGVCK